MSTGPGSAAPHLGWVKQRSLLAVRDTNQAKSLMIEPAKLAHDCSASPGTRIGPCQGRQVPYIDEMLHHFVPNANMSFAGTTCPHPPQSNIGATPTGAWGPAGERQNVAPPFCFVVVSARPQY